jgi:hypothetical protein
MWHSVSDPAWRGLCGLCWLVLIILVIAAAMLVRCRGLAAKGPDEPAAVGGGAEPAAAKGPGEPAAVGGGAEPADAPGPAGGNGHTEWVLSQIRKSDDPDFHKIGGHSLDEHTFTGGETGPTLGGAARVLISQKMGYDGAHWTIEPNAETLPAESTAALRAKKSPPKPAKKKWQLYKTWDELKKDPGASADYFAARTAALNNPQFDWSSIHAAVAPLLDEPREYVGVVGVEADGRTLKLVASEASPDAVGEGVGAPYFAGVPAELVGKYAERPALFFFHTHPADLRACPLPSSPDLATAIYFGATARFAASVVISRFGVLVYGLGWAGYKAINGAADWKLALLNYTHDVIAANESVRSWSWHSLRDYTDSYARMRMFFYAHPSPQMVAAGVHPPVMHCIESNIDHLIISEYSADIARHQAGKHKKRVHKTRAAHAPRMHIWADYGEGAPLALDR